MASLASRLNVLRAGVLGANDGIISLAGLVVGVAGATTSRTSIATAGIAGLVAGASSMAIGEYVSVSSQRDTEDRLVRQERQELLDDPALEMQELAELYEAKGLRRDTAWQVATELHAHDPLAAHLEVELKIDPHGLAQPVNAALASVLAFVLGALFPIIGAIAAPSSARVPIVFTVSIAALIVSGVISKRVSGAERSVRRVVVGGVIAMLIAYGIGKLFGHTVF
jgi:VIT1/CCC1 family predicted Fe2+/Mn2+ transporter